MLTGLEEKRKKSQFFSEKKIATYREPRLALKAVRALEFREEFFEVRGVNTEDAFVFPEIQSDQICSTDLVAFVSK